MPEWIQTIIGWLANAELRAVLAGLIISWNVTQLVKSSPALVAMPEPSRRWRTRLFAFVAGFVPTLALWPGQNVEAVIVAAMVGLSSPAAYTIAARVLYHYFPWLEAKMSAAPKAEVSP